MGLGDLTKYDQLSVVSQGFERMVVNDNTNYKVSSLIVNHNLGYTPIVAAFYDSASGDKDPSQVTATQFSGIQLPYNFYNQTSPPVLYESLWAEITYFSITFYVLSHHTASSTTTTYFFKYYILGQAANR